MSAMAELPVSLLQGHALHLPTPFSPSALVVGARGGLPWRCLPVPWRLPLHSSPSAPLCADPHRYSSMQQPCAAPLLQPLSSVPRHPHGKSAGLVLFSPHNQRRGPSSPWRPSPSSKNSTPVAFPGHPLPLLLSAVRRVFDIMPAREMCCCSTVDARWVFAVFVQPQHRRRSPPVRPR
jgi:hypothetical protein